MPVHNSDIAEIFNRVADYLVVGENPGSKYDDAKKENVKILTEDEFKKMVS